MRNEGMTEGLSVNKNQIRSEALPVGLKKITYKIPLILRI